MKRNILHLIIALHLGICLTGCRDFLEEYSQNKVYVKTAEDLNELLVGNGYMITYRTSSGPTYGMSLMTNTVSAPYFPMIHVMDDDSEEDMLLKESGGPSFTATDASTMNLLGAYHRWEKYPSVDGNLNPVADLNWERLYKHISILNVIIASEEKIIEEEGNSELLERVIGESYFLRAGYYFLLANVYGQPYAKATASLDYSVPLKTSEAIEDKYFTRDNTEKVFNQIVTDLNNAARYLKDKTPKNIHHPGYAAAQAMLSRVYLYMEQYENAVTAAEEVEKMSYRLLNLNAGEPAKGFASGESPEIIFSQGANIIPCVFGGDDWGQQPGGWNYGVANGFKASQDLITSYEEGDLRPSVFFYISQVQGNYIPLKCKISTIEGGSDSDIVSDNFSIRYGEVILNKAEALAILGKDKEACTALNSLRENRFEQSMYKAVSKSGEDLVKYVRKERCWELCFEGLRWFDLRRYAVNSQYPFTKIIRHPHLLYNAGDKSFYVGGNYELGEYQYEKSTYVLPIPAEEIEYNNGSLTNAERPERTLKLQ